MSQQLTPGWQAILSGYVTGSLVFILRTGWRHLQGNPEFLGTLFMATLVGAAMGLYSYWQARRRQTNEGGGPVHE